MVRALVLCSVALAACASDADRRASQPGDAGSDAAAPAAVDGMIECARLAPTASGVCEVSGSGAGLRIRGTVLTPGMVYVGGDVSLDADGSITCVGCDCPGAGKLITCPRGVISPGLINTHDHLTFAHSAPAPDSGERYEHRHDWRLGQHGHRVLEVPGNASPAQLRWGELRFVLGGATSTLGAGAQPGWLRNLDRDDDSGLARAANVLQTFPLDDANGLRRANDCDYGAGADTAAEVAGYAAYAVHVAEGIGASARNEFRCLSSTTFDVTAPGLSQDLRFSQAAFVHGLGLVAADFAGMARAGTALVWSPRSNLRLYGDTAQVRLADALGVRIALGTDWLATGSMNLLRELRCAADFSAGYLDGYFSDEQLWRMVSVDAAAVAAAGEWVGTLREGALGDIAIFDGATHPLWRAVIDAEPEDVALVLRAGKPLYGDAASVAALADDCDPLDVCGSPKRVCARSEIGTSLAALQASVGEIYPAFFCGTPEHEPSCVPARPTSVSGSTVYSGEPSDADPDGDGIDDANDNCPRVFNPVRPLDRGTQSDADGDGSGDVCDLADPLAHSPPGAAEGSSCRDELRSRGVEFDVSDHQTEHPPGQPELSCSVEDAVLLAPVLHGVTFHEDGLEGPTSPLLVACSLALALERTAQLLAERSVVDVAHFGGYGCRAIAGMSGLSEHAHARAFDLAALRLASGDTYAVLDNWEKRTPIPTTEPGRFLRALVDTLYLDGVFNIILTPDFNAEHENHIHLDLTPGVRTLE